MKNFQEWWDKNMDWKIDFLDYTSKGYAEEAWKAALEWVKSCSVHRLISINDIEEELKDE